MRNIVPVLRNSMKLLPWLRRDRTSSPSQETVVGVRNLMIFLPDERSRSDWIFSGALRYGLAVLICIPALWIAGGYSNATDTGLFLFPLFAVLFSAWYGGLGTGLTTTVVYALSADYYLLPPYYALGIDDPTVFFQLSGFVFLGIVTSWSVSRIKASGLRLKSLKTSTSFLDALLTNAMDGISAQRRDGSFLFINEAGARLSGFASSSEMMKLPMTELRRRLRTFHEDGSPVRIEELPNRVVFVTQRPAELTFRLEAVATDVERWINLKSAPLFDEHREVQCAVNIFRDVTATKRRQAELARLTGLVAEQNRRYQAILGNVPGMVWEAKNNPKDGQRVVFVSPYVEAMLGYTVEEFLSDPHLSQNIIHSDDRERVIRETARFYEDGGTGRVEYRVIARDGRTVPVEAYATITRDENGEPQAVYGLTMDVAGRKRAEERLARQSAELKRSNEELQQFASIASHDLQEPLRMITSYLQLLEERYRDKLDGNAQDFIHYAVDGATRMRRLIHDLLLYSRVGTRGQPFLVFPAQRAVQQAIENLALSIEESAASITFDALPEIQGDELQMVQLFQNLISNAIKFRRDGRPLIHIEAVPRAGSWQFSVRDNGIGIESSYLERIFVIFQRLHNREQYDGTGIGLAICKKIVERHGGKIWVESEPGKGSTFHFTIESSHVGTYL